MDYMLLDMPLLDLLLYCFNWISLPDCNQLVQFISGFCTLTKVFKL